MTQSFPVWLLQPRTYPQSCLLIAFRWSIFHRHVHHHFGSGLTLNCTCRGWVTSLITPIMSNELLALSSAISATVVFGKGDHSFLTPGIAVSLDVTRFSWTLTELLMNAAFASVLLGFSKSQRVPFWNFFWSWTVVCGSVLLPLPSPKT